jgi:beta-lactam-binding protein with PASTA domain
LRALGLQVAIQSVPTNLYDPGFVLSSNPAAGATATVGDTITLRVSQTPKTRPPTTPPTAGTTTKTPRIS